MAEKKTLRRRVALYGSLLLWAGAAAALGVIVFKSSGFKTIKTNELTGYFSDPCSRAGVTAAECSCVVVIPDFQPNGATDVHHWKALSTTQTKRRLFILSSLNEPENARRHAKSLREALEPLCNQWLVVAHGRGAPIGEWLSLDGPLFANRLLLITPSSELDAAHLTALVPPTLVLWGLKDPITPVSQSYVLKAFFPHKTLWRELPQCSHNMQVDCVFELNEAISDLQRFGAM